MFRGRFIGTGMLRAVPQCPDQSVFASERFYRPGTLPPRYYVYGAGPVDGPSHPIHRRGACPAPPHSRAVWRWPVVWWWVKPQSVPSRRKKPSGAQRDALARTIKILGGAPPRPSKRRRPKGITAQRQNRQLQLYRDLAWLGWPYKPGLYSYLATNLPDPVWRAGEKLRPRKCPEAYKAYRGVGHQSLRHRSLRREIAVVHSQIWGGRSK
jgi:hypothetical protein